MDLSNEYISKQTVCDILESITINDINYFDMLKKATIAHIKQNIKPAKVRPVVEAYDVDEKYSSLFECSNCGWSCSDTIPGDTGEYNFRPNCGATIVKKGEIE